MLARIVKCDLHLPSLSLILLVVASWGLYPLLLVKWLVPEWKGLVVLLFIVAVLLNFSDIKSLWRLRFPRWSQFFLILYMSYLLALAYASMTVLSEGNLGSLNSYVLVVGKAIFFIVLLTLLDVRVIRLLFSVYAHVVLLVCLMSLLVLVGVALFFWEPFFVFTFNVVGGESVQIPFYGVLYGQAPLAFLVPLARLQGFAGEPGTWALAVVPAYFYFLLLERNGLQLVVVMLAMILTVSMGAALFLTVTTAWFMFQKRKISRKIIFSNAVVIIGIASMLFAPSNKNIYNLVLHWENGWVGWVHYLKSEHGAERCLSTKMTRSRFHAAFREVV